MGIDHGVRRIGIAVSDATRTLASPLTTLSRRRGKRPPLAAIVALAEQHEVTGFVVGLPRPGDGTDPAWTAEVREFAAGLQRRSGLPVAFQDEGYSTIEAETRLQEKGGRRSRDKGRIDAAAAAVILQDWLDGHPRS